MGYTTDFSGSFQLDKPLKDAHQNYLMAFSETRRMKRDSEKAVTMKDLNRTLVNLPIGEEGAYFTGGKGFMGQDFDESVIDGNCPPKGQPGLWCQWIPTENGDEIIWDSGEKFYNYTEWLEYIINHFLKPWGYTLNGQVLWQGEDINDRGLLIVKNNVVVSKELQ